MIKSFPTCVIATTDGPVTVLCEPINDALAITPTFGGDQDGTYRLGGEFVITHRATGMLISDGPGCIECCRSAGKALAAIDIDWTTLTPENAAALPEEIGRAIGEARAVNWSCDAEYCDPWPSGAAAERSESRANHLKRIVETNARLVAEGAGR